MAQEGIWFLLGFSVLGSWALTFQLLSDLVNTLWVRKLQNKQEAAGPILPWLSRSATGQHWYRPERYPVFHKDYKILSFNSGLPECLSYQFTLL